MSEKNDICTDCDGACRVCVYLANEQTSENRRDC